MTHKIAAVRVPGWVLGTAHQKGATRLKAQGFRRAHARLAVVKPSIRRENFIGFTRTCVKTHVKIYD